MSPVEVGELTTEVVAERDGGSPAPAVPNAPPWQEAERQRALRLRLERDACRTQAEAYDA
jgi:hypothetical protein